MLQRVTMLGIELPRLYIAENSTDVAIAMEKGIPFVRWKQGNDALIRMLLRPTLEKMFPDIKWGKVLGPKRKFKTVVEVYEHDEGDWTGRLDERDAECSEEIPDEVSDELIEAIPYETMEEDGVLEEVSGISTGTRLFADDGGHPMTVEEKLPIEDYIGDMSSYVNLDVLQKLQLMPKFIGDILECVKVNVTSPVRWSEGWNKKRGAAIGNFDRSGQLPNLIILDVSGSIPRGISATMISLIDTLRTQVSADLIITSSSSRFYPMGSELPDPQTIRNQFGYGNESHDFFTILTKHVKGRHYGHVFSFGDDDTPVYEHFSDPYYDYSLIGAKVEHVHHYHTGCRWYRLSESDELRTGYAKWCHMLANEPEVEYDTSWCKIIRD